MYLTCWGTTKYLWYFSMNTSMNSEYIHLFYVPFYKLLYMRYKLCFYLQYTCNTLYIYAYYIYMNQTMQTCIFLSALLFCTYCKSNVLIANTSVWGGCGPPLGWESSSNFAELQKGCKIVLGGRAAPYLRVVTNDKYCTSCPTSYQEPDQRLYSTTARVCLSVTLF